MSPGRSVRRKLDRPIIVLGFARSGTTMLGRVFRAHPSVAYWSEPRTVWSTGNAYRPDDVLGAEHLTPRIARRIDSRFADFVAREGAERFAEKTPSNCLRVPFIDALYPDARFVHIVRDGRAVVRSLLEAQNRSPNTQGLVKRIRETPLREWPANAPTVLRTVWRTRLLGKPASFWGPRPPEWRQWTSLPPHVRAAKQWRSCVSAALQEGRRLGDRYLEIRYEDFVQDPDQWIERICRFVEIDLPAEVVGYVRGTTDPRRGTHSNVSPRQEAEARLHLEPLLAELGYADRTDAASGISIRQA